MCNFCNKELNKYCFNKDDQINKLYLVCLEWVEREFMVYKCLILCYC